MRLPPIAVMLTWPTPNYRDPTTQGPALFVVNAVFTFLVLVAVVGRFYARIFVKKWVGLDDYMCILALIFTLATTVVVILANKEYGWNRHVWDLPFDMIQRANIVAFVAKLTFTLAATFTRLSLISFYYRLVKDSGIRWFIWVLHASVVWTISVGIVFVCLTIWLCSPVNAYWIFPPLANGKCLDEGKIMLAAGVINSVSDLLITVLPIPIIMRLQMPLRQRISVCVLLCLGMVVTIAGALRTYFTWKSLIESWDETWFAYPLWICAAVEIDLGLICSCAPAWKSILKKPLRDITSKFSSLRSPSRTPNSSSAAAGNSSSDSSNPLRGLPWFQHYRLDCERAQAREEDGGFGMEDLEKRGGGAVPSADDRHTEERQPGVGTLSDGRGGDAGRTSVPALQIEMRQSLDQSSAHWEHEGPIGSEDASQRSLSRV